jgi:hypothetical protein
MKKKSKILSNNWMKFVMRIRMFFNNLIYGVGDVLVDFVLISFL